MNCDAWQYSPSLAAGEEAGAKVSGLRGASYRGYTATISSSTLAPGVESWLTHTVVLAGDQAPKYSAITATMPSMSRMSVRYLVTLTTSVQASPWWSRIDLMVSMARRVWSSMRTGWSCSASTWGCLW